MSFTRKILVGLVAGIAVGLFFGEDAGILKWVADGFVKLLQMTVLPYVTVSIVTSLGSLSYEQARTLGLRAGVVLVGLWVIALLYAFLIPLAFPDIDTATFFSSALVERRPSFNFVDLYIPSNPFNSLANNVVPAVVLFSVIVGIALIGVERKQELLDVLRTAVDSLSRATRFIVRLTPYGLFAIAANAAGTLGVEQLGRLQVYLITYVGVSLLLSLWVLPGLVAALTPVRVREMFSLTRDALITAFVAGDLFIVLPTLIDASRTLVARHAPQVKEAVELPDVLVPVSFNFPHTGKLLSLSFILFAGWFADAPMALDDYPQLAVTGLLTFFGSLNAAVPFLLDLFRIPADTFQLFLGTGVINSRFGTLVAAVHTLVVAVLGTCAITGMAHVRKGPVLRYLAITALLTVAVIGGARVLFAGFMRTEYSKDQVLAGMQLRHDGAPATVHRVRVAPDAPEPTAPLLQSIRESGVLRVGYMADSLPYSFFNAKGDLVGLDIELAHHLASELGVKVEFTPIVREQMAAELEGNCCDIVMSGVAVTTLRASQTLFSAAYLDETFAFVVPDHSRELFYSWDDIGRLTPLVIAVPNVPYYIDKLREVAPTADLRVIQQDVNRVFDQWDPEVDALAFAAERGSAWTLRYPKFSVVVPGPNILRVPMAYPIGRHDAAFASFINTWIDLKRKDGTIQSLYDYWILGKSAAPRQPRWSIIRNVLHWTDR
jgi:Na+/H+-dicarboxylate symporter/ABC-type amino acid transport substrate-binding protein